MIAYLRTGRGVFPVLLTGRTDEEGRVEVEAQGQARFVDPALVSECAGGSCEIRR